MKTGAENTKMLIATVAVAALAIVLAIRMIVMLNETPPAAATTASQPTSQTASQPARRIPRGATARLPAVNSLDPTLKLDLLKASEATEYKGSGRNIFAVYVAPPPRAVQSPIAKGPPPMQCPGDPRCPPPPIPLKFYGTSLKPGEPKKALLRLDEDVFVAAEGEIVNRRYRVLHIGVNSVEIEDVLQNNRQTIPLTQG